MPDNCKKSTEKMCHLYFLGTIYYVLVKKKKGVSVPRRLYRQIVIHDTDLLSSMILPYIPLKLVFQITKGGILHMNHYVFAPAGGKRNQSDLIFKCVEYIGELQSGGGSNFAKGKRYLKAKIPNCSGRAIKRAILVFPKVINNDFEIYGSDTYYYHIILCHKIVYSIIEFVKKYSSDQWKKDTFGYVPKENDYLDLLYKHRISQLRWVHHENYMGQAEKAAEIVRRFYE